VNLGLTPQDWLAYASPESLRLLMFKRIVGARNISIADIPTYMDEFDELESRYFSSEKDSNGLKDARLRGLYEYTVLTRPPDEPSVHVPYRQVADLAAVAPEGAILEFVTKRLVAHGAVPNGSPELSRRIEWAARWGKAVHLAVLPAKENRTASADPATLSALRAFADAVVNCHTPEDVQSAAFDAVKRNETTTAKFFSAVYSILVGAERGPRLGPYVMDAGAAKVREKILAALDQPT